MPTRKVHSLIEESVAPERCLWISKNHDLSTPPTTTKLYRASLRSHTHRALRAQTTCNTPGRTFRTQTSFQFAPDPHPQPGGRKRRKPAPSGSPASLCIPMWRTLYQKMAIKRSSSFLQRTANEGDQRHHLWRDPRFIPTTSHLHLHHHHNIRQHTSDRHPTYPDCSVSLVSCAWNRVPLGLLGKALPDDRWVYTPIGSTLSSDTLM